MGRGDKKSAKGKRTIGSFGKARSRKAIKEKIKRTASKKVGTTATTTAKPKKAAARKKAE